MSQSVELRQKLRDSINQDIADRTKIHQSTIVALKTSGSPQTSGPLVMLAHGDSWFDYPLTGNGLPLVNTDVIAQLGSLGVNNPVILNLSHHGDATSDEMSLTKQQRMIDSLHDPSNWMDHGKPEAILFSGGGNDIAGNQFCIFLDHSDTPGSTGLNDERFQKVLGSVEASYLDLFAFRDRYASGITIYGHCYDFPIPDGTNPGCAGPWIKPSLDFNGWKLWQGEDILKQALGEFKNMLLNLANNSANNFKLVDTQGVLQATDWANELHPYPDGFKKVAAKFVDALKQDFPGRI